MPSRESPTNRLIRCGPILLVAMGLVAPAAVAQEEKEKFESPFLTQRWNVFAGGYVAEFDTEAQFGSSILLGAIIKLEQDLGLESSIDTFVAGGSYRFNKRHQLAASYISLARSARQAIVADIDTGELRFLAGAVIETQFDTKIFKLNWKYSVSNSPNLAAGFTAGLSTFDLFLALNGQAIVIDPAEPDFGTTVFGAEEGNFIAPVPLVGIFIDWAPGPRWMVRGTAQGLKVNVSGTEVRVLESAFTAEYYFSRLFGLGFGLTGTDILYSREKEKETFRAEYAINGLSLYLTFAF